MKLNEIAPTTEGFFTPNAPKKDFNNINSPEDAYDILVNHNIKLSPAQSKSAIKLVASDPEYAYHYAQTVLHAKFKAGEKAIATDSFYMQQYISKILNNKVTTAEFKNSTKTKKGEKVGFKEPELPIIAKASKKAKAAKNALKNPCKAMNPIKPLPKFQTKIEKSKEPDTLKTPKNTKKKQVKKVIPSKK